MVELFDTESREYFLNLEPWEISTEFNSTGDSGEVLPEYLAKTSKPEASASNGCTNA